MPINHKNKINRTYVVFLLVAVVTALMAIIAILTTFELDFSWMNSFIEKIITHLSINTGSFLFYVGTTVLSLTYLRKRALLRSVFYFVLGIVWVGTYSSTVGFISNLGSDSFQEAQSFDIREALFWGETFISQLNFELPLKSLILYSVITFTLYALILFFLSVIRIGIEKQSWLQDALASVFILVALYQSLWGALDLFLKNSEAFSRIESNFSNHPPSVTANPKLNVFLYVGESTSVMNMALYGYPRPTTPNLTELEAEQGFVKFSNVFSTHTHTSHSLLEALSIGVGESAQKTIVPIDDQPRVSLVDILDNVNIPTNLYSNQGSTGTWNYASSIVFSNAKRTFSTENRLLGNAADYKIEKPWDHDFFNEEMNLEDLDLHPASMFVFHSYAGHGYYTSNIPEAFRIPVDDYFKKIESTAITGTIDSLKAVEDYDSTVRYIDYAVSNALDLVKLSNSPWVFIYFADHGEAVFPNRGHDSSRFIHEMARVPLIMYFNDAARNTSPFLFQKYSKLSKTNATSTLAQLAPTLLDLFDVKVAIETPPVIGTATIPAPIVIRETQNGITAVNLSTKPLPDTLVDRTDNSTSHFVASRQHEIDGPLICYHRSNTIAKALRGSLVTNCLEIDIVVDDNNTVFAYHPPAKNTGLKLEQIFSAVKNNQKLSFWLDGKNLLSKKSCNDVLDLLTKSLINKPQVLVEFPPGSHSAANEIRTCINDLKSKGFIHPSYYVPTAGVVACSKSLSNGNSIDNSKECQELEADLMAANKSGLFTDFSFDYRGIKAIEASRVADKYNWNTWHITANELKKANPSRFRMVILINDDPNNN